MKWAVMFIVLLVATILQTLLPPIGWMGGAKTPCLLAVAIYYVLVHGPAEGLVAALVAGFMQDALSDIPLGVSSLCFCVAALVTSRFRKLVQTESVMTSALFGGLAAGAVAIVLHAMLSSDGRLNVSIGPTVQRIVGTAVLGLVWTPALVMLMGGLDRLVGNVSGPEEVDELE